MPSKIKGSLVKGVNCPVINRGKVLIYTLDKTPPPFSFTGCSLCPPGIEIEETAISQPTNKPTKTYNGNN